MSLSRRTFVKGLGVGGASLAVFGCRVTGEAGSTATTESAVADRILLHNNENPIGPGDRVIAAMNEVLADGAPAGRYPFGIPQELSELVAQRWGVPADHVMIGNGSTQLLRTATQVFTSDTKPLIAGSLTYEECGQYANLVGHPVTEVPLTDDMKLDLDGMADAAGEGGMVFLNNPNNPTATVHSGDAVGAFVERILTESNETMILMDEAYHDYVTDPSYESQIFRAVESDRVVVARTFSKAHGMAGLRVGYVIAQPDTLRTMRRWHHGLTLNVPALAGAKASIADVDRIGQEQERNTAVRQFTIDWLRDHGVETTDSQTNFLFANVGMPARDFRNACADHGVIVGRDFPPFENSHARISLGTMEEMEQAVAAFADVLGVQATADARVGAPVRTALAA